METTQYTENARTGGRAPGSAVPLDPEEPCPHSPGGRKPRASVSTDQEKLRVGQGTYANIQKEVSLEQGRRNGK